MPFLFFSCAVAEEWCEEDTCCVVATEYYAKFFGGANFMQNTTIDPPIRQDIF